MGDREAEVIAKHDVGGLVQRESAKIIGLPHDVWVGEGTLGLIPSTQAMRLVVAEVLLDHPEFPEDDARVVSTGVVSDLKSLSSIDEQLIALTKDVEEIEANIKASSDPEERKQLRDEELILFRRQDGSN
jgi:hypothetical protein